MLLVNNLNMYILNVGGGGSLKKWFSLCSAHWAVCSVTLESRFDHLVTIIIIILIFISTFKWYTLTTVKYALSTTHKSKYFSQVIASGFLYI